MRKTLFLLLSVCLGLMPQAHATALSLQGVPLYYQDYNDCGPASIAMVLGYYGITVSPAQISLETKATPRSYMQVGAISAYVGRYGLETALVSGSQVGQLRKLVALGVPAIALTYYVEVGKVPHFRVVQGFDSDQGWLYLADPLAGNVRIRDSDFDMLWNTQGRVMVAVFPPAMRSRVIKALGG